MPYIRSRKFCCCLPVRFGVFCESLLGLGVGGFVAIAGWLQISRMMKGELELTQSEKISIWFVAVSMTVFALSSIMGLIGAIGRLRALVGIYTGTITVTTLLSIVSGIYLIFNLFHGETDAQIKKCQENIEGGTNEVANWACNGSFKVGRIVVVVIYVIFWLVEIYGCVIAYEYLGQLNDEEDARVEDAEKSQATNVAIVAQPPYAFATAPNAYGQQPRSY